MAKLKEDDRISIIKQTPETQSKQKHMITKTELEKYNKLYYKKDDFIGNSLLIPGMSLLSSPRENMVSQHFQQALMLTNPEYPWVYSGYEHEVGKYSRSYHMVDKRWKIINKISRYSLYPDLEYYFIIRNDAGQYDVVHRRIGERLTESFGYKHNNAVIDQLHKGSHINSGTVLYKSTAFDDSMNYRYGRNANVAYISCIEVAEDACVISESFAKTLEYVTIHTIEVSINTNELLINLMGNDDIGPSAKYKAFPDIGELTELGILCSKRHIVNKAFRSSMEDSSLRNIGVDDITYFGTGQVVGVDVCYNKTVNDIPNALAYGQIKYYYEEQQAFYNTIKKELGGIIQKHPHPSNTSHALRHIFHRAEELTSGKPIVNGKSEFENMTIIFTLFNVETAGKGFKLTGRYGEKSVIGKILKDEDMPVNEFNVRLDLIVSPQGVLGRLNTGQFIEQELTFLAENIIRDIKGNRLPIQLGIPFILEFITDVNPTQAQQLKTFLAACTSEQQIDFYNEVLDKGCIPIYQPPFWDNVRIDELRKLYKKYPYQRYRLTYKGTPIINRITVGKKYIMLLKQTTKSKYMVRSVGSQSLLGHPSKSMRFKKHNIPYPDTPIRIGEMELIALCMMNDGEEIAAFLMAYANSSTDREEFVKTIFSNKTNPLDVHYDSVERKSINRKMINMLFMVGGSVLEN